MSAQDQVIWTGEFRLDEALNQFYVFAEKVQAKMGNLSKSLSSSGSTKTKDRVTELLAEYEIAAEKAEIKLEQFKATVKSALDKDLIDPTRANSILQSLDNKLVSLGTRVQNINHKLEENISWTKGDVLALRSVNAALDNFDTKLHQADRALALTNIRIKEQDKAFKEFFYRIVVGGFALQQMGMLMTNTITRPMVQMGKEVVSAGLEFEQFEKRLEIVAGKSKQEIASIYESVRRVAKEPNITLTETMRLFNNLITISKKPLSTEQLETFGKGYTRALEAVEPSERKSILDLVTDAFSTGEFGQNIKKSLQQAPRLNKAIRDVLGGSIDAESIKKSGLDATQILMKAMENLAKQPAADSIQNKIDNIKDAFIIMGKKIFDVYKNQLLAILNWVETKLLPTLDKFTTWLEQTSPAVKVFLAAIVALTAAAGPLIYILGTLGVVSGGLAFLIEAVASGIALMTGNIVAARIATAGLSSLIAAEVTAAEGTGGFLATAGSWITKLIGLLPRLAFLISPIGLWLSAIVALIGLAVVKSESLREALGKTGSNLLATVLVPLQAIGALFEAIYSLVSGLGTLLDSIGIVTIVAGILKGLLEIVNIISFGIITPFAILKNALEFIPDLINEGWTSAWIKLQIKMLETMKYLLSISSIIGGIVDIVSYLINGTSATAKLDKDIAQLTDKKKKLGGTIGDLTRKTLEGAGAFKDYGKEIENVAKEAEETKKFLDALYESLRREEGQLRKNTLAQAQLNLERTGKQAGRIADSAIGDRSDKIDEADLSNPQQRNEARIALAANEETRLIEAKRQRNLRIVKALRDLAISEAEVYRANKAGTMYTQQLVADLETYAKEGGDIISVLTSISEDVERASWDAFFGVSKKWPGKMSDQNPQAYRKELDDATAPFHTIQNLIDTTKQLFIDKYESEKKGTDEIEDAIEQNKQARKEFIKKIEEAEKEKRKIDGQSKLQTKIDSLTSSIVAQNQLGDIILKGADTASDIRTQITTLKNIQIEIRRLNDERDKLVLDQNLIGVTPDTNESRKILADHEKTVRDNTTQLDNDFKQQQGDYLKTVIDRGKHNSDQLRKIIEEYQKQSFMLLDLYIDLAKVGITSDKEFQATSNEIDHKQKEQNLTIRKSLRTALESLEIKLPESKLSNTKIHEAQLFVKGFNDAFKQIEGSDYTDTGKLGNFITKGFQLVNFLEQIDTSKFNDIEKGEIVVAVQSIIDALEKADKIQKDQLKTKTEIQTKNYEYGKAIYEQEQKTLESKSTELDLEQQLLESKQKRGGILPEIKDVKSFGKAIIAAITGASNATYELEKRILENQKLRADNELKLALFRLEYEKDIMILQAQGDKDKIRRINEQYQILEEGLRRESDLQTQILDEKIRGLGKYGTTITEIFTNVLGQAITNVFGGKKQSSDILIEKNPNMGIPEGGIDTTLDDGMISDESVDKTGENVDETLSWLDKLQGGLGATKDVIFALGGALENLNDLSLKGIARALKEELKALGKKATVKALEYAAIAISAAVFGDWSTAGKAALAAASWGTVAVAAYAGAGILGTVDGDSASNSASAQSTAAGYDYKKDYDASRDNQLLKQKLLSVMIQLDIRTDNGQIIKINQNEINRNTALTTLVANSAGDWLTQPGV